MISFPVHDAHFERGESDLSIWEQIDLAALHQEYWADNQVSCTVKFKPEEACDIGRVLQAYEHRLKGISFLPHSDHGYVQAPYETIDEKTYSAMMSRIQKMDLKNIDHEAEDKFCDGESCMV